jgi:hypothetical protein
MRVRDAATPALILALNAGLAASGWGDCGPCNELQFNPHLLYSNPAGGVLTVRPDGNGDTLESLGITLDVQLECDTHVPSLFMCGVPAADMVLYNAALCFCEPWHAAAASDAAGMVHFSGTPRAGGCARSITIFVDGVVAGTIPLRINSPDTGTASACAVDQSDLPALAAKLGRPEVYDYCFDYNDDGATDAGDIAAFAQAVGTACTPAAAPSAAPSATGRWR